METEETNENKNPDNTGNNRGDIETRWKPGQSGNPNGRPKGSVSFNVALRREIEKEIQTSTGDKLLVVEALAKKLVKQALTEPEFKALKEIADRLEGKPREAVEITGSEANPIRVIQIIRHLNDDGNPITSS